MANNVHRSLTDSVRVSKVKKRNIIYVQYCNQTGRTNLMLYFFFLYGAELVLTARIV
jgi:hypothetical protein